MKSLIKRFNAWRYRQYLKRVARWEHTRLKGKPRFFIRVCLLWGGGLMLVRCVWDYVFHGAIDKGAIIYYLITAPLVALILWWLNESEFKAAQIDADAGADGQQATTSKGDV